MRTRTAACVVLLALTAFTTGCGSSESPSEAGKPSGTSTTAGATPAAAGAEDLKACTKALEAAIDADSEDEELKKLAECDGLSESDYEKAGAGLLEGLRG
jgi:ABC-type phosphate transport system substrate-binding protein